MSSPLWGMFKPTKKHRLQYPARLMAYDGHLDKYQWEWYSGIHKPTKDLRGQFWLDFAAGGPGITARMNLQPQEVGRVEIPAELSLAGAANQAAIAEFDEFFEEAKPRIVDILAGIQVHPLVEDYHRFFGACKTAKQKRDAPRAWLTSWSTVDLPAGAEELLDERLATLEDPKLANLRREIVVPLIAGPGMLLFTRAYASRYYEGGQLVSEDDLAAGRVILKPHPAREVMHAIYSSLDVDGHDARNRAVSSKILSVAGSGTRPVYILKPETTAGNSRGDVPMEEILARRRLAGERRKLR